MSTATFDLLVSHDARTFAASGRARLHGVPDLFFVTFQAIKLDADFRTSSLFRQHPFARSERWVVANLLAVIAVEHRTPVAFIVQLETDDHPFHFFR